MWKLALITGIGLAAGFAALGCSDSAEPSSVTGYDWRLIVAYDSAGIPKMDTLSFHWPRGSLPVKIWVEDQDSLPARVQEGITLWKTAFTSGEWNATIVADSTTADVIFLATQPPPALRASHVRVHAMASPCYGTVDLETGATRFEVLEPMHAYVFPSLPSDPNITSCLRTIAAHELGHTLGLFQESPDSLDIMYAFPTATTLSARDIATARNAYHTPSDMVPVRP
jgi:predicted Zn-dependent protease